MPLMATTLADSVARSLDAPIELLPYLPELLADLDSLGGEPDAVANLLSRLGRGEGTRALDLGCGKGAQALVLAERFAWEVLGIDGCEPFVQEARRQAEAQGLAGRCRFEVGDVREAAGRHAGFDVALLLGLRPVLGSLESAVGTLRACVRPGGFVVLDDGWLAAGTDSAGGDLEGFSGLNETRRSLGAFGDEVVLEDIEASESVLRRERELCRSIRARAEDLARREPAIAHLARAYAARQEGLLDLVPSGVREATWVLRIAGA